MTFFWVPPFWTTSAQIHGDSLDTFVCTRRPLWSRRWSAEIHDGDLHAKGRLIPYVCFVYRRKLTRSQIESTHDDLVELLSGLADEGATLPDAVDEVSAILRRMCKIEPNIYKFESDRHINAPHL